MQLGRAKSRCFTVLPGSCVSSPVPDETVRLRFCWEETRYSSSESKRVSRPDPGFEAAACSRPLPETWWTIVVQDLATTKKNHSKTMLTSMAMGMLLPP